MNKSIRQIREKSNSIGQSKLKKRSEKIIKRIRRNTQHSNISVLRSMDNLFDEIDNETISEVQPKNELLGSDENSSSNDLNSEMQSSENQLLVLAETSSNAIDLNYEPQSTFEKLVLTNLNEIKIRISELEKYSAKMTLSTTFENSFRFNNEDNDLNILKNLNLPAKTKEQLDLLENELNDSETRKKVVDALKVIGGSTGQNSAKQILFPVIYAIISKCLLSTYTWTGKSKVGVRKHSFVHYENTHNVIHEVIHAADNRYSMIDCKNDLVKKVFKYAYIKTEYVFL